MFYFKSTTDATKYDSLFGVHFLQKNLQKLLTFLLQASFNLRKLAWSDWISKMHHYRVSVNVIFGQSNNVYYHLQFHSFIIRNLLSYSGSRGGLELIPADIGWRRGGGGGCSPWTGLQSITGLTHGDRQPFTLTFTPTGHLESTINLHVFRLGEETGEPGENPR